MDGQAALPSNLDSRFPLNITSSKMLQIARLLIALAAFSIRCAAGHSDSSPKLPSCSVATSTLEPQLFPHHDSKRIKTSYGPFTVPSRSHHHGMKNFACAPPLPCENCMLVSMQAGLEFEDGSKADADTGMWLHHVVFQNLNRKDSMCRRTAGERFFASGNERTLIDLSSNGLKHYGYALSRKDVIAFGFEAMNMENEEKDVILTVIWEYVPSPPKAFKPLRPYWFDVGGCGPSDVPAEANSTFTYESKEVKAPTSGLVAFAAAHLHDGGTHLELLRDNHPCCTARASYQDDHISSIEVCEDLPYKKGDRFFIKAHYDTEKHSPMRHPDGELEPVMGISIVYALEDREKRQIHKVAIAAFSLAAVLAVFGLLWVGLRKKDLGGYVPEWLRRYYRGRRIVLDDRQAQSGPRSSSREQLLGDHLEEPYSDNS